MNPLDLIDYMVWYATTRGEVLTPIRLVKLLYLADLYWARGEKGKTLTGWPWAFVHYGPFCGEVLDAIEKAVKSGIIEARPYQSRYDGEQHFVYISPHRERPKISERLPLDVTGALEETIRKWGSDTARLLDYVYFETEPMLNAKPGQRLDFSSARWPVREEPVELRRLRKEQILEGKQLLAKLRDRTEKGFINLAHEADQEIRDALYWAFMGHLEDQEPLPEIQGTATIEPTNSPQSPDEA